MKRRKWLVLAVISVVMSLMFGLTAFAAVWRTGAAVVQIEAADPESWLSGLRL